MSASPHYLLAPGPVAIPPSISESLSWPMIHHRTPEFTHILNRVLTRLKPLFQTENPVLLLPTTGSGAMEAALTNTLSPNDEILIIVAGKFGQRWVQIANAFQIKTHEIKVEHGEKLSPHHVSQYLSDHPQIKAVCMQACETSTAMELPVKEVAQELKKLDHTLLIVDAITALIYSDLKMDEWGIDVLVAGSQKAFMLPTGLSMIALSKKAWSFAQRSKCPKFYLNIHAELNANEKGQTFFSSLVTHIRTLNLVLDYFEKEGLHQLRKKAQNIQKSIFLACQEYQLKIYSSCTTVTAIQVPDKVDGAVIQKNLNKVHNITIAGGQDPLKGKILRIGHMGDISAKALCACFLALSKEFNQQNYKITDNQTENALKKIKEHLR